GLRTSGNPKGRKVGPISCWRCADNLPGAVDADTGTARPRRQCSKIDERSTAHKKPEGKRSGISVARANKHAANVTRLVDTVDPRVRRSRRIDVGHNAIGADECVWRAPRRLRTADDLSAIIDVQRKAIDASQRSKVIHLSATPKKGMC